MSTKTTPTPETMKARIIERRCTCGRRVCDARLEGKSLVRVICPRCGRIIEITADAYSVRDKPQKDA